MFCDGCHALPKFQPPPPPPKFTVVIQKWRLYKPSQDLQNLQFDQVSTCILLTVYWKKRLKICVR